MDIFINNNLVKVYEESFSFSQQAGNYDRLSFVVKNKDSLGFNIKKNNQIKIEEGASTFYIGYVYEVRKDNYSVFGENTLSVECIGREYLFQSHYVKEVYTNKTVRFILEDVLSKAGLNFTIGALHSNEIIEHFEVDTNVQGVFQSIVGIIDGYWYTGFNLIIDFMKEGSRRGSNLLESEMVGDPLLKTNNDGYANVIRFPNAFKLVTKTEYKIGTGSDKSFTLHNPIEKILSARVGVYVDGDGADSTTWRDLSFSDKDLNLNTDITFTHGNDVIDVDVKSFVVRIPRSQIMVAIDNVVIDGKTIAREIPYSYKYLGNSYNFSEIPSSDLINVKHVKDIFYGENGEEYSYTLKLDYFDYEITSDNLILNNNQILEVSYVGLVESPYVYSEAAEIARMRTRSNGDFGVIERVFEQTIVGTNNVNSVAKKIYKKIIRDLYSLTIKTYKKHRIGDTVKIVNSKLEVNNQDFVVVGIKYTYEKSGFAYELELIQGNYEGDWTKYFTDLEVNRSKSKKSGGSSSGYIEVDVLFSQLEVRVNRPTDVVKGRVWLLDK